MKNTLLIILSFFSLQLPAQVCTDQGTSTNPDSPNAPTAPANNPSLWLNSFNWYANDGYTIFDFAIHDLFTITENQPSMTNPYSDDNGCYGHLTGGDVIDRDMFPEDGWELLSVNLGSYPNGELLTDNNEFSSYPEIPYIMLYNRNRGLIRLFANSFTGVTNGIDHVVVTLEFSQPFTNTSGLFRHTNGMDRALDQKTIVQSITSIAKHPNNSMSWFNVDFQVGYDPCTCFYSSNIRLIFDFVSELELNMVANSIETQIAAVNSNGTSTIPQDFLASVQYDDGFHGAGVFVYSTMNTMIEDYLTRLEMVENYNAGIGANNQKVRRNKAIIKGVKWALEQGVDAFLPEDLANDLATEANELLVFLNIGDMFTVKLDQAKLETEAKKLLGRGVDFLSEEWVGSEQSKLPSPTVPTVSISSTTFNGTISHGTTIEGPSLMNPGTYPIGAAGNEINPHTYPVYNEILGLFALLETPKIKLAHSFESVMTSETTDWGAEPLEKFRNYDLYSTFKFTLDRPLKYAFNPAAHINLDEAKIYAHFEVKYKDALPYADWSTFHVDIDPFTYCWKKKSFPNDASHSILCDNLDFDQYVGNPFELPTVALAYGHEMLLSSRSIPLANFNTQVCEFNIDNTEKWGVRRCATPNSSDWDQAWDEVVGEAKLNLSDIEFYLKLMVVMPFEQLGHQGQNLETVQYFTYKIDNQNDIVLTDISDPELVTTWSFNANQNNGSMPTQEILELGEKTWTAADYAIYGGSDPQHIQVYATDRIIITGNQTIDPSILSVEFIATNEVVVQNEATLIGNFQLYLDDFVVMASTPTSQVSATYLESFCSGQAPNSYQANLGSRANNVRPNEESNTPEQKPETFQARVYPTVVQSVGDVTVESTDPIQSVLVYNAIGVLVHSVKWEDQSSTTVYRMNTSDFSSGMYTVLLTNLEGDIVNRKMIVRR